MSSAGHDLKTAFMFHIIILIRRLKQQQKTLVEPLIACVTRQPRQTCTNKKENKTYIADTQCSFQWSP